MASDPRTSDSAMPDSSPDSSLDTSKSIDSASSPSSSRLPFEPGRRKKGSGTKESAAPGEDPKGKSPNADSPSGTRRSKGSAGKGSVDESPSSGRVSEKLAAIRELENKRNQRGRKPGGTSSRPASLDQSRIPDAVGKRMIRRIAVFSGVPSMLGVTTFFAAYFVITHHLADLPNVAVLLTSLGFFGLGVLGVSYGVLSSSWDESRDGSLLGADEFRLNARRMIEGWKSLNAAQKQTAKK